MKPTMLFFLFFTPLFLNAQVNDSFIDGNFNENPEWTGTIQNFIVNSSGVLQSNAKTTSTSTLFTTSESFVNAAWECNLKITYTTSSSNFASIYIASDNINIVDGFNGYFVQVGGTTDEVSLYLQQGTTKTKIIDGIDKRTDLNILDIKVKVKRDANGNFELYSKLITETDYYLEGKVQNTAVGFSNYFGLLYSNTSTTGSSYYFDDIRVTGEKAPDTESPRFNSIMIEAPDKIKVSFTEKMKFTNALFDVDKGIGVSTGIETGIDYKSAILTFGSEFQKGEIYTLSVTGLTDFSDNELVQKFITTGIPEPIETADLVWNEIMFENPENSVEYLEIYNKSNKLLNISGLEFTTRKMDGSLNTSNTIPEKTFIAPQAYLVFTSDVDSLRKYYNLPLNNEIIQTSWATLNNQTASIVLCNGAKDTIYDELTYNAKWHHILVKNPKGVALERINPFLVTQNQASWHSAGSDVNYGTPGFENSQFREIENNSTANKFVWVEPEAFSPDMDGVNDVCFIHYKTNTNGFVANVLILNSVGEKIFRLASNNLLSTEGYLIWDGHTDKGLNANAGIYILYFEAFNPQTGEKIIKKLPVVLTSR